ISFLDKMLCGLEEIWNFEVVHRDITPGNIMMKPDGSPVIIDFGIARYLDKTSLTGTYLAQGPCTPPFAPPEVLTNNKEQIDCRSDLFSLGIVVYIMTTGIHPIWDNSKSAKENRMNMIEKQIPSLKDHLGEIGRFIDRMVQKEPYKRFRNPTMARKILDKYK
ncbi:MAG: serine/threonine protein kinase, partial [bacterium]